MTIEASCLLAPEPFVQNLVLANNKEIKLYTTGPLCGESIGDLCIPFINGQ